MTERGENPNLDDIYNGFAGLFRDFDDEAEKRIELQTPGFLYIVSMDPKSKIKVTVHTKIADLIPSLVFMKEESEVPSAFANFIEEMDFSELQNIAPTEKVSLDNARYTFQLVLSPGYKTIKTYENRPIGEHREPLIVNYSYEPNDVKYIRAKEIAKKLLEKIQKGLNTDRIE